LGPYLFPVPQPKLLLVVAGVGSRSTNFGGIVSPNNNTSHPSTRPKKHAFRIAVRTTPTVRKMGDDNKEDDWKDENDKDDD